MVNEQVEHNRSLQRQVYGEPLGDLFRRVGDTLGLTQARLAQAVGISAPMLSQLISAQRAKIGNPAVVQRVQALLALTDEVAKRGLGPDEIEARIREIKGVSGVFTRTDGGSTSNVPALDPRSGARVVQGILRAVASAEELSRAATRLDREFPALAEVLRVYGTGRTADAQAHFDRVKDLM